MLSGRSQPSKSPSPPPSSGHASQLTGQMSLTIFPEKFPSQVKAKPLIIVSQSKPKAPMSSHSS